MLSRLLLSLRSFAISDASWSLRTTTCTIEKVGGRAITMVNRLESGMAYLAHLRLDSNLDRLITRFRLDFKFSNVPTSDALAKGYVAAWPAVRLLSGRAIEVQDSRQFASA